MNIIYSIHTQIKIVIFSTITSHVIYKASISAMILEMIIGSSVAKINTRIQKMTIKINGHFPVVPIKLFKTFLNVESFCENIPGG